MHSLFRGCCWDIEEFDRMSRIVSQRFDFVLKFMDLLRMIFVDFCEMCFVEPGTGIRSALGAWDDGC